MIELIYENKESIYSGIFFAIMGFILYKLEPVIKKFMSKYENDDLLIINKKNKKRIVVSRSLPDEEILNAMRQIA